MSTDWMRHTNDLHPGDPLTIAAYHVLGRLGAGGQGVVYLGVGPLGQRVAIKQLHSGLEGEQAKQLFTKEVAAARLVAPFCTARVLDAQLEGPSPYVISEYIEGPSLQQYIQRHGPMKGIELERLAIGTATALAAIHQAGVVHRDFKPANVMLAEDGPRVIDFGVARDMSTETTVTGKIFGTPSYMAPEQVRGERVGPATDMFAWASVIAYAATGRTPFEAPHVMATVLRITNEQPDLNGVPEELLTVMQSCLTKDPTSRPTAQQVLAFLLGRPAPVHDMRDATLVLAEATNLVQADWMAAPSGRIHRTSGFPSGPSHSGPSGRGRALTLAAGFIVVGLALWGVAHSLPEDDQDAENVGAVSTPAINTPAISTPAAKTSAAKTPAAKTPAAKAPAVKANSAAGAGIPAAFGGDWQGTIFPTAGNFDLWNAKLSLTDGDTGGTFTIDDLGCSGPATVTSAETYTLDLRVVINDDPDDACAARGTLELVRIGTNTASLTWQDGSNPSHPVTGVLKRPS